MEFKKCFSDALRTYTTVWGDDQTPGEESDIAYQFMMNLDRARYSEFIKDHNNRATQGEEEHPETLMKMYYAATKFQVQTQTGKIIEAAVYHTQAKSDKKKDDEKSLVERWSPASTAARCTGTASVPPILTRKRQRVPRQRQVQLPQQPLHQPPSLRERMKWAYSLV